MFSWKCLESMAWKLLPVFFILRLIFTWAKKSLFHIWSYHLNHRSQWPWFRVRHIVFMRYTYLPNLIILEQVVFSLRVGQDFSLFGHIILLKGHSDPILKNATHRLPKLYQLTKFDDSRYDSIWVMIRTGVDRQTTDKRRPEKLTWAFSSGELIKTTLKLFFCNRLF
jgi:hypothetical protein